SYPDLYLRTLQLGAIYTQGALRYQGRGYWTQGKQDDLAAFASIAYDTRSWIPELYLVGGRDAASRPYLTQTESETFLTIGAQLTFPANENWKVRALYEDRQERGYRLKAYSLSLLWAD
ncbi:hypothetical protein, partial [Bradyrhizobium sp. NBAIM08]|uniref:hypothetical protein n=1 Tax=Bradyrhizobium sp. NBAIM08 TaxID=2793815 RepID=UPI001CD3395E